LSTGTKSEKYHFFAFNTSTKHPRNRGKKFKQVSFIKFKFLSLIQTEKSLRVGELKKKELKNMAVTKRRNSGPEFTEFAKYSATEFLIKN
jgi:hypothetical protein